MEKPESIIDQIKKFERRKKFSFKLMIILILLSGFATFGLEEGRFNPPGPLRILLAIGIVVKTRLFQVKG